MGEGEIEEDPPLRPHLPPVKLYLYVLRYIDKIFITYLISCIFNI